MHPILKWLQLPPPQQRMAGLVAAGTTPNMPVALFGPTGAGKSHLVLVLADTLGIKLGIVQFSSSPDTSQIISTLEIGTTR